MPNKLFPNDQNGLTPRPEARPDGQQRIEGGAIDLRSEDPSYERNRAAHRRTTWLYEDLLN